MSEVGDAVQIIVVAGKGIYMLGRITLSAAIQTIKMMNTIYLSKWEGKAGLRRLRQIKGDDLMFLNAGSEGKRDLKKIEREMKQYGILFARMPDLCGGDGRTQYAVASSDAPKVRALLIDHSNGRYRNISLGMLSEKDYLSTGMTRDGTMTKEMEDIVRAPKDQEQPQWKPEAQPAYGFSEPQQTWGPGRKWTFRSTDDSVKYHQTQNRREDRTRSADLRGGTEWHYGSPDMQASSVQEAFSDVRTRMRDLDVQGLRSSYQWIPGIPVDVEQNFVEYSLDQAHSVFVPIEDVVLPKRRGPGMAVSVGAAIAGAALFRDKSYTVVDRRNASFHVMSGNEVLEAVRTAALEPDDRSRKVQNPEYSRDFSKGSVNPKVRKAVPEGVTLNGIPDAKSLDAPVRGIPHGRSL